MSVDLRVRVDGPLDPLTPRTFFGDDLPAALAVHAAALAPAVRWYRPRPLTVACGGGRWTLRARGDELAVAEGGGGPMVRLTAVQLADLAADRVTPLRWVGEGALDGAPLATVLDWWVLMRGALDGVSPYAPGTSGPVAGYRAFRPDDDPVAMAAFLESAGYLHLTGMFTAAEMAQVSADIDRAVPARAPGGGRAWWAVTDDGHRRQVRMPGFEAASVGAGAVLADRRLTMIGRLTGDGHTLAAYARPGLEALVKPPGAPDTTWHKDCAFGRHSYDCASLTVGVAVTDADAGSGHLRVLAGSHRELLWPAFVRAGCDLPVVDLPARAGDMTVHLSCTAHMALPAVRAERRALYTAFGLPPRAAADAPSAGVA